MSELGGPAAVDDATFQDLFDEAPCGYLLMAVDGRIERANSTLVRWLGTTAESLVGQSFGALLSLPARVLFETSGAPRLRLQGGFDEMALDLRSAEGKALHVLASASAKRDGSGRVVAIRVALFKAVERRGYERDLQGREAAAVQSLSSERDTSKLREQFIAVLGHDLRNPLASIRAGAHLLRKQSLDERGVQVVSMMEQSVSRMAGLIENVLDFARGRLGAGLTLSLERRDLTPVIEQVISELRVAHPEHAITSELRLERVVDCDPGRLSQLVSNLIGNALTHGAPDEPVRVRAQTTDATLQISVTNGGEPIPASAMKSLFQPFERGTLRPNLQGLGLGLYICSEIARAHGGTLGVKSDGSATTFTFTMPLLGGDKFERGREQV